MSTTNQAQIKTRKDEIGILVRNVEQSKRNALEVNKQHETLVANSQRRVNFLEGQIEMLIQLDKFDVHFPDGETIPVPEGQGQDQPLPDESNERAINTNDF